MSFHIAIAVKCIPVSYNGRSTHLNSLEKEDEGFKIISQVGV